MISVFRTVMGGFLVLAGSVLLMALVVKGPPDELLDQLLMPAQDLQQLILEEQARRERYRAKQAIIERLERGEITLLETAARFRELNAQPPRVTIPHCLTGPSVPEEERQCREAILFIRAEAWSRPQLRPLIFRLENQLR